MVRLPRTARDVLGWGKPPRQILRRGAQFATVAPALTTAERQHIERVLGAGRVALCLVALATLAWDPTWNGSHGQLPIAMLGGYAVVGVLQLAGASRRRAVRLPSYVSHGVDVAVAAALTVATVSPPSSPFLLFFLFAVLGAAYRWGAGASVLTAIVAVIALCVDVLLGDVALYGLLTWSASLLVTAFVVGGLAQLERQRRARVATERSRVARELHDGIIQALAGLRFEVAAVRRRAESGRPVVAELASVEQALAEQTIAARELMHRMRPLDVTPRQLPAALGSIVERFTRETGIPAHYHTDLEDTDLTPRTCRELACTLQEALVNVRKHSGARHVVVRFSADPIHYRLTVDNDGRPFDFAGRLTLTELEAARRGPLVIKERVREMGGELVIESSADRGVRLDILLRRRLRARSSKTA